MTSSDRSLLRDPAKRDADMAADPGDGPAAGGIRVSTRL